MLQKQCSLRTMHGPHDVPRKTQGSAGVVPAEVGTLFTAAVVTAAVYEVDIRGNSTSSLIVSHAVLAV